MKKYFYVFRHGQTDKNVSGRWQGSGCNDALNSKGLQQAEELAEKVVLLNLDALYSSSLTRAKQTAEAILRRCESLEEINVVDDLREVHFGEAEGHLFTEYDSELVNRMFYPTFDTWHEAFPGGESKCCVFDRVVKALRKIAQTPAQKIGIVCHAGVLSSLQCGLQLKDVDYSNCSILKLVYDTETGEFSQD